jgi:BirA family biotin operon repressor/biotin-[acetyl-CoA-carboxylase] ligase
MNVEEVRDYCLSLKNTTESFPFDDVTLVFKVENKMYLLIPLDEEAPQIAVKCDPDLAIDLRERYYAVTGAHHFNKKYWNTIYLQSDMMDDEIRKMIHHSYNEVIAKLPKNIRSKYEEEMNKPMIIRLSETESTNKYLSDYLQEKRLPEGSAVIAEYQTAGRGQAGSWESAEGENLTFSIVFYPEFLSAEAMFYMSMITALAVKDTLDEYTDDITVKWPNDIYWKDRKICGILIENSLLGYNINSSIIGIGLNVNQAIFISNAPNPVSLFMITKHLHDREVILHSIIKNLHHYYNEIKENKASEIHDKYKSALYRNSGFFTYRDASGSFDARIADIDPSGRIHLQLNDKSVRIYSFKEVEFIVN